MKKYLKQKGRFIRAMSSIRRRNKHLRTPIKDPWPVIKLPFTCDHVSFPSAFDLLASSQVSQFLFYLAVSKTSVHTLPFNPQSLLFFVPWLFFCSSETLCTGLNYLKGPL